MTHKGKLAILFTAVYVSSLPQQPFCLKNIPLLCRFNKFPA